MITRRQTLGGLAGIIAAGTAPAAVVRSMVGARNSAMVNNDKDEDMYKELFYQMMGRISKDIVLRDTELTELRYYCCYNFSQFQKAGTGTHTLSIDFPNVTTIGAGSIGDCFNNSNLISVNLPKLKTMAGGNNFQRNMCTEIYLPLLTNFNNHTFSYSSTLKRLILPSVVTKTGNYFCYQCTALEHVYLDSMSLSDLGGASYIAQQSVNPACIFHLRDGNYDYKGDPI